jgi:hypothetical protein
MALNLAQYFMNPAGLYALLALVPFILLYIIRPKPKKLIMPSLMFFMRDKDKSNINSFLQKFFQDLLFYLQFIVLLLLALMVAKPFIVVPSISYADTLVFIVDGSASMNAIEDGKTRFDRAKEIITNRLEARNTIIIATDTSQIIAENVDAKKAKEEITMLKAKGTTSSLYDSIVLAENFISTERSSVVVISDFSIERLETEFFRAKSYLNAKGISVFFEDVSLNKARNIGIIDLDVKDSEITVWIKNFNNEPAAVNVDYGDKSVGIVELEGNDVQSLTIPEILNGKSIIEIDAKDDFSLDNSAYISTPQESSINIMLITNSDERYLTTAMDIMKKIRIQKSVPPLVSFNDPDVIILGNVDQKVLIPGDIAKIKDLVKNEGVSLVVLAQDNILGLGLGDMLPLEFVKRDAISSDDVVIPSMRDSYLTPSEIQFGIARRIYEIKPNNNVITYAETSKNKYPVITLSPYGKGKVLFYGLFDESSEFKSDIFYPVFWKRAIDLLIGGKSLAETNKKTGYFQENLGNQEVITPEGRKRGSLITLDHPGFYDFNDLSVAANLLSEEEQRLNKDNISIRESHLSIEAQRSVNDTKEREISEILLIIVTALIIIELFYLKIRGDV